MAIINQVLTIESQDYFDKHIDKFDIVKNLRINYRVSGYLTANNCLIKIQKKRDQNSDLILLSVIENISMQVNL